jgi:hypothetical protein
VQYQWIESGWEGRLGVPVLEHPQPLEAEHQEHDRHFRQSRAIWPTELLEREFLKQPVLFDANLAGRCYFDLSAAHYDYDGTLVRVLPFPRLHVDVVFHEPVSGALACAFAYFRLPQVLRDVLVLVPWWYGMLILNGD